MPATKTSPKSKAGGATAEKWSADELAAMKERNKELKAAAKRGAEAEEGERDLLAKIAEMPESDRVMAERIHGIVKAVAPELTPRTWYGMPAWAKDGKLVCFFKAADKFKSRYATLGFEDAAKVDDGSMWPTSYALTKLTDADSAKIAELVKKAAQ